MNLEKIPTQDLQIHSNRLYNYHEQLQAQIQHIKSASSRVQGYDVDKLVSEIEKESALIAGAMQLLHNELEKRMEKDLGIKLNTMSIFDEISAFYSIINQAKYNENGTLKIDA